MKKLILRNSQSPGDLICLAHAVISLHLSHPNKYLTDVRSPCSEIFENNPYITLLDEKDPEVEVIDVQYPDIHQSSQKPLFYINSMTRYVAEVLKEKIEPAPWNNIIYINEQERHWYSAIYEILGKDVPWILIAPGWKCDFPVKAWSNDRWQQLIDTFPELIFVHAGLQNNFHIQPKLTGKNLINLVNKCDTRQFLRLVYNSAATISLCSFPMMASYAVPYHPRFGGQKRLGICLFSARESITWQHGPNQHFLHSSGLLPCSGCWKSRIIPLNDGDPKDKELCLKPVQLKTGQVISACMDLIWVEEVIAVLRKWKNNFIWNGDWS